MWHLRRLEVNGGFLPGLTLDFPVGLTCIIGPRGSGKSTLAEMLRFTLSGAGASDKSRLALLQANLGVGGLVTVDALVSSDTSYIIKRALKQQPIIVTGEGRPVASVDLDRGTFLPFDAYSSSEIESIADETLGDRRRALLDDLRPIELQSIQLSLAEHRRALDANADRIRAQRRLVDDLTERVEELGDVQARFDLLGPASTNTSATKYAQSVRQTQFNVREIRKLSDASSRLAALRKNIEAIATTANDTALFNICEPGSANEALLSSAEASARKALQGLQVPASKMLQIVDTAAASLKDAEHRLTPQHSEQAVLHASLTEQSQAEGELVRERASLEQQIAQLEEAQHLRVTARTELEALLRDRASVKALYLIDRERVSTLRQSVAEHLQSDTGTTVRIRVMRNGDDLPYRQLLLEGIKGARVRNHDDILHALLTLRPEHLAQLIASNDLGSFEEQVGLGGDRSRKVLDALRENTDPLNLEVVVIEDRIRIELNVSTSAEPNFRDASELSRGQKCTALLPLLLARRESPLIIDQPEDNLDNHFIYETVVDSIRRLKLARQMIFITHNANIPVLAEADLVVVMNSDGRRGYIEKVGSLDDCRDEVIDLLEGGREAFELRTRRYARI